MAYAFKQVLSDKKDVTYGRYVTVQFAEPYTYETYAEYDENGVGIGEPTTVNDERTFDKTLRFSLNATNEEVKRAFKRFLDDTLNVEITPVEDLTITEPAPDTPTQAELDRQAWQADRQKLATLMELVRDGVFTGSETQITNLQAKVKADFKAEYLD